MKVSRVDFFSPDEECIIKKNMHKNK